jgi:hypothetical protein
MPARDAQKIERAAALPIKLPFFHKGKTNNEPYQAIGTPKKIRTQSPDVIVAVREGDARQEFECYKVVLAFASPYLDAMLSSDMVENSKVRIEFRDNDPEEWQVLYQIILNDPDVEEVTSV